MIARITQGLVYLVIPVIGIFFFEWDWRSIILLYWLENITVGFATAIGMIRTRTLVDETRNQQRWQWTVNGNPAPNGVSKIVLIPFFILHYGIFTLVHGVFVFLLISGFFGFFNFALAAAPFSGASFAFGVPTSGIDFNGILIAWGIASVVQLVLEFMKPAETLPAASALFLSPYKRIIVLHLTVLFGAGLIIWLNWPPASALLLVALHFVTDVPELRKEIRSGTIA